MEIVTPAAIQTQCKRCGECCRKGSPTLHVKDSNLIKNKTLTYADLYTIRKGELVYNNIEDELITIDIELIKIKEKEGSRVCFYLKEETNECTIYENRPVQCRAFECWNTDKLLEAFAEEKISREPLVEGDKTIRQIVEEHDEKCSYLILKELFARIQKGDDLVASVLDILRYDTQIRPFLREKLGIPEDFMPLLLGRPLVDTIIMFGYVVEHDEDGNYILKAIEKKENKEEKKEE